MTQDFATVANDLGLDISSRWVGRYVEHVWRKREFLTAYLPPLEGLPVLEFGCAFGATAIVLARLGAKVVAIDVKDSNIALSQANAAKHGESVTFQHVADTRALPFPPCAFRAITCVSVLEYVKRDHLPGVLRELDRVLAPGGVVLIQGTSNRIFPMEAHSRRWFVNWLPHWIMPSLKRGIWPGEIAFEGYENLALADNDRAYLLARKAGPIVRTTARVAHAFGKPLGYFTPSIYLAQKKPVRH